jgi:DNA repair protein RecN (Recombination protein N)
MALRYGVEELARMFTDYGQKVEHNPERLAEVSERLEALNGLKKKYGPTLEDVLAYQNKARRELDLTEALDASLQDIQQQIDAALASYTSLCVRLSDKRKKASRKLSRAIEQTLNELGMSAVQFCVEMEWREDPEGLVCVDGQTFASGPRGLESGEFSLSTNPGEAVHPLVKVASGGEVSRIMLAMKTVLAHTDSVQVLIFDEIDLGISGRIAEVVGRQLKALSGSYQTISITHLPQIAKMADVHFSVRKKTSRGRTVTRVDVLAGDDRAEELAKMMGGETISDLTMEHAREMLEEK